MNIGAIVLTLSAAITGAFLGGIAGVIDPLLGNICASGGAVFGAVVGYTTWAMCVVSASADKNAGRK